MKTLFNKKILKRLAKIFALGFAVAFLALNSRFLSSNVIDKVRSFSMPVDAESTANEEYVIKPRLLPVQKLSQPALEPITGNAMLIIEKIGARAPIMFDAGTDLKVMTQKLEEGVLHYSLTPKPGEAGNAMILGHSSAPSTYKGKYGYIFTKLPKLVAGDSFSIVYDSGKTFTYVVEKSVIFKPLEGDPQLFELDPPARSSIVLVTCYPIFTASKRIGIVARLVE